ncbi:MAG: hypothetical protein IPN62_02530 [Flavobacteriales bacterium]|nr:hypothetical protein [Flavobacteriales bacterium]
MASPSVQLPDELIKLRSLYTLSGLASMVWLICLVIAQLMPHPDTLAPWHWRLIAFTLSCGLTFYTTILRRTRARGKWGLAVLNSFLVFVNASGINAVTSGLSFIDKDTAVVKEVNAATHASIYLLDAQVNWWPDTHLVRANEELKAETLSLAQQNDSLAQKIQIMINQGAGPADLMHCAQRLDSLQQKATELRAHVDALTGQLAACRTARGNGKPKAVTPPVKAGGTDAKPYIVKSGKENGTLATLGKASHTGRYPFSGEGGEQAVLHCGARGAFRCA